jgi:hypothetical protein
VQATSHTPVERMATRLQRWRRWLLIAGVLLTVGIAHAFVSMRTLEPHPRTTILRIPVERPGGDTERLARWLAALVSQLVEILKRLLDREE